MGQAHVSKHQRPCRILRACRELHDRGDVLEGRRKRTRNALVHGNPAGFPVIESVRPYAEFLGGWALHAGLESSVDGGVPADALNRGTEEFEAMRTGVDAASYWRTRVVASRSSANS